MSGIQSTTETEAPALLMRRGLRISDRSLIFAHPLATATFGSAIFLFAWMFPPQLYTQLVGDDYETFLDPAIMMFNALCGALIAGMYVGSSGTILRLPRPAHSTPDFLRCPFTIQSLLCVLILANTSAFVLFARQVGFSAVLAALRDSQSYLYELRKNTGGDIEEPWKLILLISAVSIPAAWHFARSYGKHTWTWWLFWIGVATYIPAALLTTKRNFLILPLFGVLLSHLVWTKQGRQISMLRSAITIVGTGVVMVMLFLALASARNGVDGIEERAGEIVRYVVGPYNTETLIVNKELSFPGEGKGYLWTHCFWTFPVVANVLNFNDLRDELIGSRVAIGVRERKSFLKTNNLAFQQQPASRRLAVHSSISVGLGQFHFSLLESSAPCFGKCFWPSE